MHSLSVVYILHFAYRAIAKSRDFQAFRVVVSSTVCPDILDLSASAKSALDNDAHPENEAVNGVDKPTKLAGKKVTVCRRRVTLLCCR